MHASIARWCDTYCLQLTAAARCPVARVRGASGMPWHLLGRPLQHAKKTQEQTNEAGYGKHDPDQGPTAVP